MNEEEEDVEDEDMESDLVGADDEVRDKGENAVLIL